MRTNAHVFSLLALSFVALPVYSECPPEWEFSHVLNDASPCLRDEKIRKRVEKEAVDGSPESASMLADYYLYGAGSSEQKGIYWLRIYAKNSTKAPTNLGQLLLNSDSPSDVAEGEGILLARAREGDLRAAEVLANYLSGTGRDTEARAWYEAAALAGSNTAMERLGELMLARDDLASKHLGVMWMLAAASTFEPGTYKHNWLINKARSSSSQFGLNYSAIETFVEAASQLKGTKGDGGN